MTQPTPAAPSSPFVMGIIGDSGSGKSTVCDAVRTLLGSEQVTDLKLDDYLQLTRAERRERGLTSLDPAVHDFEMMHSHLLLLRAGRSIRVRRYEHANGTFGAMRTVEPRSVVLVRGLLGFPTDAVREAYDLGVFLHPEPELLFRWKLRRDVRSRGYTQAQVLNYIARHLLDSKEFVLPQAGRADLVVRYELPAWDAPDSQVVTTVVLRRAAARNLVTALGSGARFDAGIDVAEAGGEVMLRLTDRLRGEEVNAWGARCFPETFDDSGAGRFESEEGAHHHQVQLAFVQLLIARLAKQLRQERPPRPERSTVFIPLPEQLGTRPPVEQAGP